MTQVLDDSLAPGREAAARGAWRQAYDLLKPSEDEITDPTDLEIYAEATWWSGMLDKAIALRERAFAAYTEAGEDRRAAVVALQISSDYFGKAQLAPSAGWFGKAERLLDGQEESPEHGYLAVTQSFGALMSGDFDASIGKADLAYAIGQRFGDRDLQALGLTSKGRALVLRGEVDEGLRLLDEATAAAVSGELRPFSTGLIYCVTITSCNNLGDYRRGSEWTEAANKWCERQDLKGFPGACRVHHSTALRLKGDWDAAEEQAVEACEELRGFDAWTTAVGFYEIGEIRRRRGDFAAAEEAYKQAKEWGRDPQPGLALLRLAQGKVDAAATGVKRSLAAAEDEIGRFRRLPAQVEIALATGDLETARAAATELGEIADKYMIDGKRTPSFEAEVCLAWARIKLEDGDPEEAAAQAQHALDQWRSVSAPYETAEAQVILGLALRRQRDEDGALDELAAARATFERLGAVLAAQRTGELSGEVALTRTFMFTDIVDSTKLAEALGETKWQKLLAWHDRTLRELLVDRGGEVIKQTGDGFFAAFESPGSAVEAAVAIQRALDTYEGIAPDVRIGLHSGGAFATGEGDYGGQGVHAAARIGALATGGEILVSTDTLDGAAVPYSLSEPRELELKGLTEPVPVVSVAWR
jgi:class 3 adenylate cyclase